MKNQDNLTSPVTAKLAVVCAMCLVVFASPAAGALAGESSQTPELMPLEAVETKVVDGFFMGLTGRAFGASDCSTNNTSTDDAIIYVIWTTGSPAWIALPAEPEYAYQIDLLDTNGVAVPKTELGNKLGTKFYDFGPKTKVTRYHAYKRGQGGALACLFLPARPKVPFWPDRPSDLFKITNPGRYTLRIRFQILTFPRTGPNRGDYTNDLIRFPPLEYLLFKAANTLTNPAKGGPRDPAR